MSWKPNFPFLPISFSLFYLVTTATVQVLLLVILTTPYRQTNTTQTRPIPPTLNSLLVFEAIFWSKFFFTCRSKRTIVFTLVKFGFLKMKIYSNLCKVYLRKENGRRAERSRYPPCWSLELCCLPWNKKKKKTMRGFTSFFLVPQWFVPLLS